MRVGMTIPPQVWLFLAARKIGLGHYIQQDSQIILEQLTPQVLLLTLPENTLTQLVFKLKNLIQNID